MKISSLVSGELILDLRLKYSLGQVYFFLQYSTGLTSLGNSELELLWEAELSEEFLCRLA